ncbi:MAG: xanthine dehydrogenase family protein molybdopterin-binding subunit [Caldisericota bacterium]|nr:xanthine dehydrogenase family protein molybdopterin-binding subunit [Caldisericota bacterium]
MDSLSDTTGTTRPSLQFEQIARIDARDKASGRTRYMSDLSFPGMLYATFVRSRFPHALIRRVDTSKALALPGVVAVLTAADVPGFNGFGIVVPDMPVICGDKVRYLGDTVALVAAESGRIAEQAAKLVDVDYEELPVVDDPVAALLPNAPKVHDKGNICLHTLIAKGDVEQGFREADLIIDHEYRTPRQAHVPLETESGVAVPEADGSLSMYAGSQYAFRDQLQLARILGMNPRMIHVVSNPVGGGFGSKDELTIQGGLALLAMKTGRPVKVSLSREESLVSGWKRHPFIIRMKTGFKKDGTLVANDVVCYEDKGAYSSLGGPVLNLALEHASSLYRVPNTRHEGWAVFTNNGTCGAMRGFGVPQVLFAIESNMNEAAEKLGLDSVTIRHRNVLHQGEVSPIGHTLRTGVSMDLVLDAIERSDLWQRRTEYKRAERPWLKRGVALAIAPQGAGLGLGIPDYGGAYIDLEKDGTFTLRIGLVEYGQGTHTGFVQMAAALLHVHPSRIRLIAGQTRDSVDAGPATASRSTYTASNAIAAAYDDFCNKVEQAVDGPDSTGVASSCTSRDGGMETPAGFRSYEQLAEDYAQEVLLRGEGYFVWPTADREIPGAAGLPHWIYSFAAQAALVEVNTLTGETQLLRVATALDTGCTINREQVEAQIDGGVAQGQGFALSEDTLITKGQVRSKNFSTYVIPTVQDVPSHEYIVLENPEGTSPLGVRGIGEVTMVPIIPAIPLAIHDATGVWVRHLPATPERVYRLLHPMMDE